jgi:hypothetical protein
VKTLLIILIILALSRIDSFSQFSIGPKIGGQLQKVTFHTQEFREQFNSKVKHGFLAGFSMGLPVSRALMLKMDLAYTNRGRKVLVEENGWTLNEMHHAIELPVQLLIMKEGQVIQTGLFEQIGPFTWYFGVGPNISYWLGGSGKLQTQVAMSNYTISYGGKESDFNYISFTDVNRLMWGLDFSFGLISPFANGNTLVTDLKFTYGHSDLGKEDSSYMPVLGFADNLASNYRILTLSFSYWYETNLLELKKGKSTGGQKIKTKRIGGPTKKTKNVNKFKF